MPTPTRKLNMSSAKISEEVLLDRYKKPILIGKKPYFVAARILRQDGRLVSETIRPIVSRKLHP